MQHKAVYYSASSLYMFRVSTTPSSGVHKTVTTASGAGHIFCAGTSLQRGQASLVDAQKIWPVPEIVVTVLCTLDDGRGWHPKHVEWTRRIINRLLCAASRWTVTNTVNICRLYGSTILCFTWCNKRQDFRKTFLNIKMCLFIFYTNLCEIFVVLRRILLMKFNLSRQSLENNINIKLHGNSNGRSRVVPRGQTNTQ